LVTKIEQSGDCTFVNTDTGVVKANYVIVASALPSAAKIKYEPELPIAAKELFNGICPWNDPAVNVYLVLKDKWAPGLTFLPDPRHMEENRVCGPVMELSERATLPDGSDSGFGIIRILVQKEKVAHMSKDEIIDSAFDFLEKQIGNIYYPNQKHILQRSNLHHYWVEDWTEIPTIPGVTYYWPTSTLTKTDENGNVAGQYLRASHGRVHFAGAERSVRGLHWMEGAVRRGNEVAADLLKEMGLINSTSEYMKVLIRKGQVHSGNGAQSPAQPIKAVLTSCVRNYWNVLTCSEG